MEEYSTCWKRIAKDLGLEAILFYNVFFLNLSTGLLHHVLKRGWGLILNVVKAPIWRSYISTLEKGQLGERNDSRAACVGGVEKVVSGK